MKERKYFTKDELLSGMIVVTRSGEEYYLLKDIPRIDNTGEFMSILVRLHGEGYLNLRSSYNEYLLYAGNERSLDIMKVKIVDGPSFDLSDTHTAWERDERKEMTLKEIEDKLGYKIKLTDREFRIFERVSPSYSLHDERQFNCPNCGYFVTKYLRKKDGHLNKHLVNKHCWNCGQALDFDEIDESYFEENK